MVEGVHLSLNAVMRLMAKYDAIVPFLIHIRRASAFVRCSPFRSALLGLDTTRHRNCVSSRLDGTVSTALSFQSPRCHADLVCRVVRPAATRRSIESDLRCAPSP